MRSKLTLVFLVTASSILAIHLSAKEPPKRDWLQSTAYVIPKYTATEGEGYFAIVEGHNRRLYIGTHANAVNSWLVEFDPAAKMMDVVVDAHEAIGIKASGFAAQSKIHSRNNVGKSGKIYFATKQGYPTKEEPRSKYPGGYPMVYDPETGKTKVYPIPVAHQGIISITPDESRGVAYISTCDDARPKESTHFIQLDLKTGKYRDLMDCEHMYAFIVVDDRGRAYHPILGGDIARFDPDKNKLQRLTQKVDGKQPGKDSLLASEHGHPINWDISPDRQTLYSVPMSDNALYRYDLTTEGKTLVGRKVGELIPGAKKTDCRGMCVGPSSRVWCSVTEKAEGTNLQHLVSYRPGDAKPKDHGAVAISNPDYTDFTDKDGKELKYHRGLFTMPDGTVTTRYVTMGVCEAKDGNVYVLMIHPYTVLQVSPAQLK